jgi:HAD superfamily hydrolase (TIGR01509 family)
LTACLLFDLDGTLTDTDHLHFEAMRSALAAHGVAIDWTDYRTRILGASNADIAAEFLPRLTIEARRAAMDDKERRFRAQVDTLTRAEGLTELLEWAAARGLPTAVVTNAPRANAELMLRALGLTERFDAMVLGDELARGKPDPLPYLEGLRALGGDAARSVAFEDSRSGVRSAAAAGLATVGIGASATPEELIAAGATIVARDFTDPRVLDLARARIGA